MFEFYFWRQIINKNNRFSLEVKLGANAHIKMASLAGTLSLSIRTPLGDLT